VYVFWNLLFRASPDGQNRHNKGFTGKFVQAKGLAPRADGIPTIKRRGMKAASFSIYFKASKLAGMIWQVSAECLQG
jgi:hypothetical protein